MEKIIDNIIEMLKENKEQGCYNINESLTNWLELDKDFEDLTAEDFEYYADTIGLNKNEIQIVYEITPFVSSMTDKIAEIWENIEE